MFTNIFKLTFNNDFNQIQVYLFVNNVINLKVMIFPHKIFV